MRVRVCVAQTAESGVLFNSKDGLYTGRFKLNRFVPGYGKLEAEADTAGKAKGSFEADQAAKHVVAKITYVARVS